MVKKHLWSESFCTKNATCRVYYIKINPSLRVSTTNEGKVLTKSITFWKLFGKSWNEKDLDDNILFQLFCWNHCCNFSNKIEIFKIGCIFSKLELHSTAHFLRFLSLTQTPYKMFLIHYGLWKYTLNNYAKPNEFRKCKSFYPVYSKIQNLFKKGIVQ